MSTDFKSVDLSMQKKNRRKIDRSTDRQITDLIFWDTLVLMLMLMLMLMLSIHSPDKEISSVEIPQVHYEITSKSAQENACGDVVPPGYSGVVTDVP